MPPDWLGACRGAARDVREVLAAAPTTAQRVRETGTRGEGGDATLRIDAAAEDAVFARLAVLHDGGARFTAVSEERGRVDFGDPGVLVVIDPIDGSLNAKRGVSHHSLSIAVAEGDTMDDVVFGFVHDFGPREEWVATRGGGAALDGTPLGREAGERRSPDGRLEVLGVENSDPRLMRDAADALVGACHRVRALGSIAVTLCQVAAARFDGMVTLRACRGVDAAAGQLIVREAGGHVAFTACAHPLGAPLDTDAHSPLVAARTPAGVQDLRKVIA